MQPVIGDELEAYAFAENKSERKRIEQEIWDTHGIEQAIYIQDMSGFSRLTLRHGIIHYLSMVQRMQRISKPVIEDHGGCVVKFEADNAFARFPDTEAAILTGIEVNRQFEQENKRWDKDHSIEVAIGIDFGRFLLLKEKDFWGSPVNLASKLGEDTANPGEILVTSSAWNRLPDGSDLVSDDLDITVSGVDIDARRVVY